MKIRKGLVSNSSSSSFTCLIQKDAFDKAYKISDEYTKAVIKALSSEKDVFGMKLMLIETWDSDDYNIFEDLDLDFKDDIPLDEYGEKIWESEVLETFLNSIPTDQKFEMSQDW
jgi:hypothetical protein